MIGLASNRSLASSDVVHHVAYIADRQGGYQILCCSPWAVFYVMFHARIRTEVDPVGRTMTISLTRDPVDCMSCLVVQARR